jgi:hypothetical protein
MWYLIKPAAIHLHKNLYRLGYTIDWSNLNINEL